MNKLYILAALGISTNALWTLDDFNGNYAGDCLTGNLVNFGWNKYDCGDMCDSMDWDMGDWDDTTDYGGDAFNCECYDNYGACGTLVDDPYYDPYYGGEPQIC